MQIIECTSDDDIRLVIPVIQQLYDRDTNTLFNEIKDMCDERYTLLRAEQDGKIIAAVGYRLGRRLYSGRYLHIDNLVVDKNTRGSGVAKQLLTHLKQVAKAQGCETVLADSYITNSVAQSLFLKEGFYIRGFHLKFDH